MGERIPGIGKRVSKFVNPNPMEISCPDFYILHWARGCPFDCSYCFLKRTFARLPNGKAFHPYDAPGVERHVDKWLAHEPFADEIASGIPASLNAGELADAMVGDPALISHIATMFTNPMLNPHRRVLVLLTKNADMERVRVLFGSINIMGDVSRIVVSSTVNTPEFVRLFERRTPEPQQRLAMLAAAKDLGFRVRVRVDPVAPWLDYRWLADRIMELKPEVVTLGSFRLYPRDKTWFRATTLEDGGDVIMKTWASLESVPGPDGRLRPAQRLLGYRDLSDMLVGTPVALCKEPITLLDEFQKQTGRSFTRCNCCSEIAAPHLD